MINKHFIAQFIRRAWYALVIYIIPSGIITGADAIFMNKHGTNQVIIIFIVNLTLLSYILLSVKYFPSILKVSLPQKRTIRKLHLKSSDLVILRKSIYEMQEKERIRMASSLHDNTMRDIFWVQEKIKELPRGANTEDISKINYILNQLELINVNLKYYCFELNPTLLKSVGLVNTIQNLVNIESHKYSIDINLITDGNTQMEKIDLGMKRHIFRIIQQLLNNSNSYLQALKITVKFTIDDEHFYIGYLDYAAGFEREEASLKATGKPGNGLGQVRSRIHYLGGGINIVPLEGQGVKVNISIPLKDKSWKRGE